MIVIVASSSSSQCVVRGGHTVVPNFSTSLHF